MEKRNACVLYDTGPGRRRQSRKWQIHCVHKIGLQTVLSGTGTDLPTFWEVTSHCNSLPRLPGVAEPGSQRTDSFLVLSDPYHLCLTHGAWSELWLVFTQVSWAPAPCSWPVVRLVPFPGVGSSQIWEVSWRVIFYQVFSAAGVMLNIAFYLIFGF